MEKIIVWGWIGLVTLAVFLDMADYFTRGSFEQKNCEKNKKYEIKLGLVPNLYHIMMSI